jgi:glycine/D-amino acid oxidase-like deaminating enzyme
VATFDTDLRESGGLRLAATDEELDKLEIESNFIEDTVDITCPILSKKEVQSILPKTGFAGGMYIPTEATFNPYKIVNGLREWIERKSSRILTDCQVTRVEDDGKGFAVSILHKGTIKAKKIVYCTNAYIPELIPELKDDITPFRGQIVVTDHLDDSISQLLPSMSMSCNNGSEYFRTYGGRLLVGGMRHAVRGQQVGIVNDGEVSPAIYDRLRGFVSGALPFIQNAKFTHTWSGIMCTTSDRLPLIGPRNDKLNEFILGGFNGYGFSHALYGSMIIKNFIESGFSIYTGAEIFDPRRFQNDL